MNSDCAGCCWQDLPTRWCQLLVGSEQPPEAEDVIEVEHKFTILASVESMPGLCMTWGEPEWTNRLQRVQICLILLESPRLGILLIAPRGGLLPTVGDSLSVETINTAVNAEFAGLVAECPKCNKRIGSSHKLVHTCQKGQKGNCQRNLVGNLKANGCPRGCSQLQLQSQHLRGNDDLLDKVRRMISGFAAAGFRVALTIDLSIDAGIDLQSVL